MKAGQPVTRTSPAPGRRSGSAHRSAHLVKDSLDGAVEQVTPMLALSPEYRIATVTGWLTDLDHHLARKRFASSPAAAGLRQQIGDFSAIALPPGSERNAG
jgi:hypothetical protein